MSPANQTTTPPPRSSIPLAALGRCGHRPGVVVGPDQAGLHARREGHPPVARHVGGVQALAAQPERVVGVGEDRHVAEPAQRRQVGVVVVQVREQHRVDVLDVRVVGQVVAAGQRTEAPAQQRVGEDAGAAQVEDHAGVPEPCDVHPGAARGRLCRW